MVVGCVCRDVVCRLEASGRKEEKPEMSIAEVTEENKQHLRLMKPHGFIIEEGHGAVRLTYKHGGVFISREGFIKLWTQNSVSPFYHEALFETAEYSKPFRITSDDIIELGNSNPDKLWWLIDRLHRDGYEDYTDAN